MNDDRIQSRIREIIKTSVHLQCGSDCWIWKRQISNSGYGKVMVPGPSGTVTKSALTASYTAFTGTIPQDSLVVQTCGERLCVNPEHLELKSREALQQKVRSPDDVQRYAKK